MPWWLIALMYLIALHVTYKWGYKNGYNESKSEKNTYETLTESDVDKINDWQRLYVYQYGSYPENWDLIRKINKKFGRGMFNQ